MACIFKRDNANANSKYYNLTTTRGSYIIAAYGDLDENNGSYKLIHILKQIF